MTGAIVALAAASPASAKPQLKPDLQTLAPSGLNVQHYASNQRTVLRLDNRVANRGIGPMELRPEPEGGEDCNHNGNPSDDRLVDQAIYLDEDTDGLFNPAVDTDVALQFAGCRYYHPEHHHYHFDDFAQYDLRKLSNDAVVARSRKVSFCLGDSEHVDSGTGPNERRYTFADCTLAASITGISPGWADLYIAGQPGQSIDVTGLAARRYCLVSTADPDNRLVESNDDDNARRTLIRLNPQKRIVRVLGAC